MAWWDVYRPKPEWLPEGELSADVFKGLRTTNGDLSIYLVNEQQDSVNRVIAALACTRDSISRIDYVLIPREVVEDEFRVEHTSGNTADDEVNGSHVDVVELTLSRLADFAYLVRDYSDSMKRVPERVVKSEIEKGIETNRIQFERIRKSLREKI